MKCEYIVNNTVTHLIHAQILALHYSFEVINLYSLENCTFFLLYYFSINTNSKNDVPG